MKTDPHPETSPMPAVTPPDSTLQVLLERESPRHKLPGQVDGLMIGTLHHIDEAGHAQVQPDNVKEGPFPALSMVPLKQEDVGTARFVLGFQDGNPRKPVILGRVWVPPADAPIVPEASEASTESPSRRIVLQADEELELRCGEAVILLQADGRIQLRGRYITSHAEAGQRIRGGSVQIN
ncbi:DUF6484 domain-containing protein [Thauera sp. SDU_THAU2]|uniref:DUF6484 domain-containing protein n=1 Tax=Thauera sp. SDU_THAU2 TaxID=3136633 RepID=UPI00311D9B22